jgi:hypothetical protein
MLSVGKGLQLHAGDVVTTAALFVFEFGEVFNDWHISYFCLAQ